jgi:hypothetical protein
VSDPQRLDLGDWALTVLAGIFVGIVSGLASAMAWFRGSKGRIYERIKVIEQKMEASQLRAGNDYHDIWAAHNEHEAQLRVLTNAQANSLQTLGKIEGVLEKQDEKLDKLLMRETRGS